MKKGLLLIICVVLSCLQLSAWSKQGHSSIAEIAERHLTARTHKALNEYLHGEHLATVASIPDDYRKELNKMGLAAAHTYSVDGKCESIRGMEYDGHKVVNLLIDIDRFSCDLYNNHKLLNDTIRACEIIILVHIVGDMHCPGHVRYYPDFDAGYYNVLFLGNEKYFHGLMDGEILTRTYPWSYSDIATICDIKSEREIKDIVSGDQYSWGKEHALNCIGLRAVPKMGEIDVRWIDDQSELVRLCIRNAGYRLAHVLNTIFDHGYSRSRQNDFVKRLK